MIWSEEQHPAGTFKNYTGVLGLVQESYRILNWVDRFHIVVFRAESEIIGGERKNKSCKICPFISVRGKA